MSELRDLEVWLITKNIRVKEPGVRATGIADLFLLTTRSGAEPMLTKR
jgi:hypothetical protein